MFALPTSAWVMSSSLRMVMVVSGGKASVLGSALDILGLY